MTSCSLYYTCIDLQLNHHASSHRLNLTAVDRNCSSRGLHSYYNFRNSSKVCPIHVSCVEFPVCTTQLCFSLQVLLVEPIFDSLSEAQIIP